MHVHTVEIEVTCTELLSVMDAKGKQASIQTSQPVYKQANDMSSRLIHNIPSQSNLRYPLSRFNSKHTHSLDTNPDTLCLLAPMSSHLVGKMMKRPFARQGQMCMALLTLPLSTCMETFPNMPSLGR